MRTSSANEIGCPRDRRLGRWAETSAGGAPHVISFDPDGIRIPLEHVVGGDIDYDGYGPNARTVG